MSTCQKSGSLMEKLEEFLTERLRPSLMFTSTLLAQGVRKNWFHFRVGASATFLVLIKCFVSNTQKLASCSERFLARVLHLDIEDQVRGIAGASSLIVTLKN